MSFYYNNHHHFDTKNIITIIECHESCMNHDYITLSILQSLESGLWPNGKCSVTNNSN